MTTFTCMECLAAEATKMIPGEDSDDLCLCEPCLRKATNDVLLDLVNDGRLQVSPDGIFSLTPEERVRRSGEEAS